MLFLQLPCGDKHRITASKVYGRGSPESLSDPLISRQQLKLDHVCEGVLHLTNVGMNPIIVERQDTTAAAAAAAAAQAGASSAPQWHVVGLLEKGDSICLQADCRFYLASLQDTTTFTVIDQSTPDCTASAAAAAAAAATASDYDNVADLQQRQQQRTDGFVNQHDQEAADAALAAALAAEDQEQQKLHRQDSSDWHSVFTAAAAAEQDELANDRPHKRVRYSNDATAAETAHDICHPANTAGPAAAAAAAAKCSTRVPGTGEGPFSLFAVRGLSPASNTGFLGARLGQLVVSGNSSNGSSRGNRLVFALASNYMVDMGWLLSACPDLTTVDKLVVVHGEKGDRAAAIITQAAAAGLTAPRFAAHAPPLPITFGTHHSKGFLLGYADGGVRVIIHTANYIYPDCNNKTQGIWYQDFPAKAPGSRESSTPFEDSLADYVRCLELPRPWCSDVLSIIHTADFSAARVALVASVPGYHTGPVKLHAYGHMRLRALLSDTLLPQQFTRAGCIIQCSSLGSLDEKWLRQEFMASMTAGRTRNAGQAAAAGGTAGQDRAVAPAAAGGNAFAHMAAASRAHAAATAAAAGGPAADVPLYIVWPSVCEVQHSREGWAAGYSIPGPAKNVTKPFLQRYWCRFDGSPVGRQSAMPHIKTYGRFITHPQHLTSQQAPADTATQPSETAAAAAAAATSVHGCTRGLLAGPPLSSSSAVSCVELPWWLVTSHNLSKAAWGSLQVCQRGPYRGHQQLMIRSYELGVLATPELEAAYLKHPRRCYSCTAADAHKTEIAYTQLSQQQQQEDQQVRFVAWHQDQQPQPVDGPCPPQPTGASSSLKCVYLPVPYCLPPQPYREDDTPWCVDVQFSGFDGLGFACGDAPFRAYGNTEPAD